MSEVSAVSIVESRVTCTSCPVQIEGRLSDGRFFYLRSRHSSIGLFLSRTSSNTAAGLPEPAVSVRLNWDRHAASDLWNPDLVLAALVSILSYEEAEPE